MPKPLLEQIEKFNKKFKNLQEVKGACHNSVTGDVRNFLKQSMELIEANTRKETKEEDVKMLMGGCPLIEELKYEGDCLWVKIPQVKDNSSFQILPEKILSDLQKALKE